LDASVLGFNSKLLDMESYRSLDAWKHAHAAVILVHKSTQDLNRPKYWAILDQLRRAVISVETNIVEGYALKSQAQLLKHLWIAFGSAAESECLVRAVAELGYLEGSVTAFAQAAAQSHAPRATHHARVNG